MIHPMRTLLLVLLVSGCVARVDPDHEPKPPPPLECVQVGGWQASGCDSSGCWARMQCNRFPSSAPEDLGPAVHCQPADESGVYLCRWSSVP